VIHTLHSYILHSLQKEEEIIPATCANDHVIRVSNFGHVATGIYTVITIKCVCKAIIVHWSTAELISAP